MVTLLILLACSMWLGSALAFTVVPSSTSNSAVRSVFQLNADQLGSRRLFSKNLLATSAAFLVSSSSAFGGPLVAEAAEAEIGDDLSMPDEPKTEVVSEEEAARRLQERLAKKAALQKRGSMSIDYKENFANEMSKQKDMKKTQAEKRAAMCEELGRGC
mmetsp:Transcript_9426/g.18851  ORF Transcript_9426/g.18851 Transcript_9426/m.18851 type:complete len:159 (+) Transcript_9426:48-524(+)